MFESHESWVVPGEFSQKFLELPISPEGLRRCFAKSLRRCDSPPLFAVRPLQLLHALGPRGGFAARATPAG